MPEATDGERRVRLMSEGELFNEVATLLKGLGWRYFHIPATAYRHGVRAGFPDLVTVRDGKLIFAELKRERETLLPEQWEWAQELGRVCGAGRRGGTGREGVRYFVWRPSNLLSGEIAEILAGNR